MIDIDRARELDDDRHINYEATYSQDEYSELEDKIEELEDKIEDLKDENYYLKRDVNLYKLKDINEELYEFVINEEIYHCADCDGYCLTINGLPEQGCWNCNYDDYHANQLDLTNEEIKLLKEMI